jgi:hypothetical protein
MFIPELEDHRSLKVDTDNVIFDKLTEIQEDDKALSVKCYSK